MVFFGDNCAMGADVPGVVGVEETGTGFGANTGAGAAAALVAVDVLTKENRNTIKQNKCV